MAARSGMELIRLAGRTPQTAMNAGNMNQCKVFR
jgi:hypothetical protein